MNNEWNGSPDLVIVGAGIAGGALAAAAARRGLDVLLLERTLQHQDHVRGEFMPAWGVDEASKLGVLDIFLDSGAHFVKRFVGYGEDIDPHAAEARAIQLDTLVRGVKGALTFGHPQVCTALDAAAVHAGATLMRGISQLEVTAGDAPQVSFLHDGTRRSIKPKLAVAADGRGSAVARSLGIAVQSEPVHHLLCGLLVDGADAWPDDRETIGTEGELLFYVFPQGGGKVRLYAGYAPEHRSRFSGSGNAQRLLDAFRLNSVPLSKHLVSARPIGPCNGYPGGDTWLERIGVPGVVFIGDAAGHNCPTIGQGVTIALRDARHVLEALANDGHWSKSAFSKYSKEREERMRRLRFVAHLFSTLRCEFGPAARERRKRAFARVASDPRLAAPLMSTQVGPFALAPEVFTSAMRDKLLA
jgi:2-polyprenyl-6-methoxyphenol hydroxylase-like FAD-dependent oxidoreductase